MCVKLGTNVMQTKTLAICNKCETIITSDLGFIIHGNVYKIKEDINARARIIGNAFPVDDEKGNINSDDIQEYAYHYGCLSDILTESLPESHTMTRQL